jgi:hypothetical protein
MLLAALVGFESRQGQEIFLFSVESRLALWSTQPLVQCVSGAVPPRVKRQSHEADQVPPRSGRTVPSLPHISSWHSAFMDLSIGTTLLLIPRCIVKVRLLALYVPPTLLRQKLVA